MQQVAEPALKSPDPMLTVIVNYISISRVKLFFVVFFLRGAAVKRMAEWSVMNGNLGTGRNARTYRMDPVSWRRSGYDGAVRAIAARLGF